MKSFIILLMALLPMIGNAKNNVPLLLSDGTSIPPIEVGQCTPRDDGKCVLAPSKALIDSMYSRANAVPSRPSRLSPCFPHSTEIECQRHYTKEELNKMHEEHELFMSRLNQTIKEMEQRRHEHQMAEIFAVVKIVLFFGFLYWLLTFRKKSV